MSHYPSFPLPSEPLVPPEVFYSFHSIDRNLYSRLVFQLGRDPAESARVMALWLWLEVVNVDRYRQQWFKRTLLPSYPGPLNAFADESVAALNCLERDPSLPPLPPLVLPMFRAMTGKIVTLKDFYDNRVNIAQGVDLMFEQVCVRAFRDLTQRAVEARAAAVAAATRGRNSPPVPVVVMRVPLRFEPVASPSPPPPPLPLPPQFVGFMPPALGPLYVQQNYVEYAGNGGGYGFPGVNPDDDLLGVRGINFDNIGNNIGNNIDDLSEVMRGLQLSIGTEGEEEDEKDFVPADERTIFLTFSKGYPITEAEVRDFFASKYGDGLIENIYMQDVRSSEEQPLYARLVVRSLSYVDAVLGVRGRKKFFIGGKHLWARKFVRKNILMTDFPSNSSEEASAAP